MRKLWTLVVAIVLLAGCQNNYVYLYDRYSSFADDQSTHPFIMSDDKYIDIADHI